ncbi:hypothetical protein Tco_1561366, partial [Tanacetum coccineum]
ENKVILTLDSLASTLGDLSHETPIAPTTTNAVGGGNSLGVRQVKPFGERRKAKRKRGQRNNGTQKGKEALVVEAEVEGYLIRRVHIDEGASVEIMIEHCFNMLHPAIWARLVETQTTVSRAIMKFTIIPTPSSYNIIFGRLGLKQLRVIPSTIHCMMKFLTPWGITTLVSQVPTVFECRRVGKKQAAELPEEIKPQEKVGLTEQVHVNPAYPEQLVVIGKGLSPEGSTQLKNLLKENKDIFA